MSTIQFTVLKLAVQQAYERIKDLPLFCSNASKDELWDTYLETLGSLGHNEIYRERGEHDCQCCKSFIRKVGNIVAIKDGQLHSIWDEVNTGTYYDELAATMSNLVKSKGIRGIFLSDMEKVGTDSNVELMADGTAHTWEHFYLELNPALHVETNGDRRRRLVGHASDHWNSLKLSCEQLTLDAVETVLDLVNDGALYRGTEHKGTLELMKRVLTDYHKQTDATLWLWTESRKLGSQATLRSTVIGTLVKDLSSGMELEQAVKSFEAKVAPHNYKRSTALVTKGMIKKAEQTVKDLGIEGSLARRPAVITDITVNNVLYADRAAKDAMDGVFGSILKETRDNVDLSRATPISIKDFLGNITPTANHIEALLENRVADSNAMTLVAPVNPDAPNILKWDNNFTWTYKGDVTDSIKEKVKAAGGKVDGALRVSLAWDNSDDLDLHLNCPRKGHVYYGNRCGMLDVDMNAERMNKVDPVENITYHREQDVPKGQFIEVKVNNFHKRGMPTKGFTVQVEYKGELREFTHDRPLHHGQTIDVVKFKVKTDGTLELAKGHLPMESSSKDTWGLTTQKFHRVSTIMHSPNHWDGNNTGNKHYFFMLEGFKNPDDVRGLYNEFLSDTLREHRKVFEVLGSKLKAKAQDDQLNGLGFSETVRNHLIVRVDGRLYKVEF